MLKRLLYILALPGAFVLGHLTNPHLGVLRAQSLGDPGMQMAVPKSFGALRAASDKYLVFEDSAGTIRLAYIESGLHKGIEVTRN